MRSPALRRAPWPDMALGALLFAVTVAAPDATRGSSAASVAVAAAAVALRRVWPMTACVLASAALVIAQLLPGRPEDIGTFVALLVTIFSVAAHCSREQVAAGAATAFSAAGAESALNGTNDWAFGATFIVFALGAGVALRRPLDRSRQLAQRAQDAEREGAEAVARERTRLARELHDIVAHGVSVMVLQAAAAEQLCKDTDRAAAPLRAVQATGRETLAELQRLLGVLRADGDEGLAPQPTLAQLDALLDAVRTGDLGVELCVHGQRRPLAASVESSAYRVIQEALTNVVRHSGARHVRVTLDFRDADLDVRVEDDGRGVDDDADGASGRGLRGMRERLQLLGGTLDAGARSEGGFAVRAVVPLEAVRR